MLREKEMVSRLTKSQLYSDYEAAFNKTTCLPLAFRPTELWQPALHNKRHENPFCALMAKGSRSCAACLQTQQELVEGEAGESTTVVCFAGLCDSAIPITAGDQTVGFLQTGQVALRKPSEAGFSKIADQLLKWGVQVDLTQAHDAYFCSRVISKDQYEAMLRLLEIFGKHLSLVANQLLVVDAHSESPAVIKAKQYIGEHRTEQISLEDVARHVNVSTFYFCKLFKNATGLTFTEYVSRTRIEKAKNLLLNPHARVSEVAYACGFESLTHFNRTFKRIVGISPTDHRTKNP